MSSIAMFLMAIFIFVIVSSLFVTCNSASPYYMDTIFQKFSKFESFSPASIDYSSRDNNSPMDTYKQYLIQTPPAECTKIYGFNGLFCKPGHAGDHLDMFAGTEGKLDCTENSGLSNSKGGLCLSPEQKRLLATRGGNITLRNDEIGH
jgi:hypothetical protein